MSQAIHLGDADVKILMELLEREQRELPTELRRTETSALRDTLRQRQQQIATLLERFRRQPIA